MNAQNIQQFFKVLTNKNNAMAFAFILVGCAALCYFVLNSLGATFFCIVLAGLFYAYGNQETITPTESKPNA